MMYVYKRICLKKKYALNKNMFDGRRGKIIRRLETSVNQTKITRKRGLLVTQGKHKLC